MTAGRTYNALRAKFDRRGVRFPPLAEIDSRPASESLELVSKIERVAPPDVLQSIQRQVMEGQLARDELRALWESYKPVLGGMTKRGLGTPTPRYDERNVSMRENFAVAHLVALMVECGPGWLGIDGSAYLYRVMNTSASGFPTKLRARTPDVIVLFAETKESPLVIHGVEVGGGLAIARNLNARSPGSDSINVDFLWYASAGEENELPVSMIPDWVGILDFRKKSIEVVRHASGTRGGRLSKDHLLRMLLREMAKS